MRNHSDSEGRELIQVLGRAHFDPGLFFLTQEIIPDLPGTKETKRGPPSGVYLNNPHLTYLHKYRDITAPQPTQGTLAHRPLHHSNILAKKDRSLKEMLARSTGPSGEVGAPLQESDTPIEAADKEGLVTRAFLEALFSSLKEDLQAMKRDLPTDIQEVCRNLEDLSDRVSAV
ncbi:hypothetical protein NDU88_004066 [Pleurodeles waltl]|uniref:Uncharacterized protein n=1 Tax=Pleurodeles waltl TaxID=8319 RepID=A0AAV7M8U0_PLEWA|nr:hypothetical protein NDU88_004066 [Pleurodeles waltl]